jgi:translation initiation factor IF-2
MHHLQWQGAKKFAVILAFDVPVTREARELAESMGVRIFTADIIYHLFDQFTAYLKQVHTSCNQSTMLAMMQTPASQQLSCTLFTMGCGTVHMQEVIEASAQHSTGPTCMLTNWKCVNVYAWQSQVKEEEQEAAKYDAVFPCVLKILPTCIFNKKDPIVLGVEIVDGIAKVTTPACHAADTHVHMANPAQHSGREGMCCIQVGTPVTVPSQGFVDLGRIASMELNHKAVNTAKKGDSVAMKLEPGNTTEASRLYGRHFDHHVRIRSCSFRCMTSA